MKHGLNLTLQRLNQEQVFTYERSVDKVIEVDNDKDYTRDGVGALC